MMIKKGAMFGLDARIALAIFGALSVISGAALYSAIKEARVTSYIVELREISKAVEQYMLDTGENLPKVTSSTYAADIEKLISSTKSDWKGPYLSSEYNSTSKGFKTLLPDPDSTIYVDIVDDAKGFGGGAGYSAAAACSSSATSCSYWPRYNHVDLDVVNAIEEKIDGTIDFDAGNVRASYHAATLQYFLYIKGPRTLSTY